MAEKSTIDFKTIENKWQKKWEEARIFETKEDKNKKKFYVLEMFPYPSGSGLHMGHTRNYAIGDCISRFKRMCGFNVLYPMGWDSFGLPSENAAIKEGIHPVKSISKNIETMKKQMTALGISYDWTREIATHEKEYYIWDQWLFLKLLKNDLAYRKKSPGNWCPGCKTTLANEDVKSGKCWRCDTEVVQKDIEQWFFKITDYSDELLDGLNQIEWSTKLKALQKNWIGKSEGVIINFKSDDGEDLPLYTTRPDTLFGVTFVVFAPEHPKITEFVKGTEYEEKIREFLKRTEKLNELDRMSKEKDGLFIGKYAINTINGDKIPIYIANFVLMNYGTGMIMAVPSHDQRDFEFAKKYDIPIKVVIQPESKKLDVTKMSKAYVDEGVLVNSGEFDGMNNKEAIEKISDYIEKNKLGERKVNYKIRDWCISRQRYWGSPIPIIYCEKCGVVPVPEKDLPVILPLEVDFTKGGVPPLSTNENFVNVTCPKCGKPAKRETDTMTTFVDSSWYFFRYCSPMNNRILFDKDNVKYWLPVDQYIGGIEHAVGHLMYSRFVTRFLKKLGHVDIEEPFSKLLNHGIVNLGGVKMSKSKGNVVDPMTIINKYCADTLRAYFLFVAQPDTPIEWSDKDIYGIHRFIEKIYTINHLKENEKKKKYIESITQNKIKLVTEYMENLDLNKAMIELIDFLNKIEKYPSDYSKKVFLKMVTPFAPHVCEEVWEKMGNKDFISVESWPKVDETKIDKNIEMGEKLIKNILNDVEEIKKITKIDKPKKVIIFVCPEWKYDIYKGVKEGEQIEDFMKEVKYKKVGKDLVGYVQSLMKKRPSEDILKRQKEIEVLENGKELLEKTTNTRVEIITENNDNKKAKQAGPMKPGILIE